MALDEIQLESSLEGLSELLDQGPAKPGFALPSNLFLFKAAKEKDKRSRRGIKELIQPENAECVVPYLPGPGERTHCILRGDFVLCDLIPAILRDKGRCDHLHVATLGLSSANADCLATLRQKGCIGDITLVCSHYFAQVDKNTTYRDVTRRLEGKAHIIVARAHAKVICLPTASGDHYVIEGSANLRSSDNTEQMVIFNDSETLQFHRAWMEALPNKS